MSRDKLRWTGRQVITFLQFVIGVNLAAGWAEVLSGGDTPLPGWLYPLAAAGWFMQGVVRLIEDAKKPEEKP